MMRIRLLVCSLTLSLVVLMAGRAVAAAYAPPTVSVVDKTFAYNGLKIGTGLFRVTLAITAGADGAPAGFTVEWMKKSDYDAFGGWAPMGTLLLKYCQCYGPYSVNQWAGSPILGPGQTSYLQIGDLADEDPAALYGNDYSQLMYGTQYVFRAYTEADGGGSQSAFSSTLVASTMVSECTQGFWKTHGPPPCQSGNNTDTWPAGCFPMVLGTVAYTDAQICSILLQQPNGNGLISLAHQLITALLNGCNGSDLSPVSSTIAAAQTMIGGLVVPPVGGGFLDASTTSSLTETLDDYNNGLLGGVANCPTPVRSNSSWGHLKTLYR